MEDNSQQAQPVTKEVMAKGTLTVGLNLPTPLWATITFRIVFILTTAITFWLAGTALIKDSNKMEIMLALKSLDVIVWGLGKMLGIKPPNEEQ